MEKMRSFFGGVRNKNRQKVNYSVRREKNEGSRGADWAEGEDINSSDRERDEKS